MFSSCLDLKWLALLTRLIAQPWTEMSQPGFFKPLLKLGHCGVEWLCAISQIFSLCLP